ncbi:dynein heavy chain 3, axonemal [Caerostris extrusa]|uniref:Dynein heavy chain 3, axonemal n=1 Tax=Caerostris extrusa TaxID=172846 RepID=A0AAV4RQR2_CAEEX|nr:dynein heavy chain 3, axonemal [Caerostris extrusa]
MSDAVRLVFFSKTGGLIWPESEAREARATRVESPGGREEGAPSIFWLSGFFLYSIISNRCVPNYARKYQIPIDHLGYQFEVLRFETEADGKPEDGAYVLGLFLEGARWDRERMILNESYPKVLYDTLPVIWIKPGKRQDFLPARAYSCPRVQDQCEARHPQHHRTFDQLRHDDRPAVQQTGNALDQSRCGGPVPAQRLTTAWIAIEFTFLVMDTFHRMNFYLIFNFVWFDCN